MTKKNTHDLVEISDMPLASKKIEELELFIKPKNTYNTYQWLLVLLCI